jgi:putative Ca2+/H+ antiporter (TMEM165/GDT1 family)
VFAGAAAALILASAIGVAAGGAVSRYLNPRVLHTIAGIGFIVIGIWTLTRS